MPAANESGGWTSNGSGNGRAHTRDRSASFPNVLLLRGRRMLRGWRQSLFADAGTSVRMPAMRVGSPRIEAPHPAHTPGVQRNPVALQSDPLSAGSVSTHLSGKLMTEPLTRAGSRGRLLHGPPAVVKPQVSRSCAGAPCMPRPRPLLLLLCALPFASQNQGLGSASWQLSRRHSLDGIEDQPLLRRSWR